MLLTLAFILWAYGMYALITAWSRRRGGNHRGRSHWRRYGWLTLAGSSAAALGLILWLASPSSQQERNLKLAGFLGDLGWADKEVTEKAEARVESPPIKGQGPGDQPAYAYLHPETPPNEIAPERKPPTPRPMRKPKLQKMAKTQAKGGKVHTTTARKEKATGKSAAKKKKPQSSPATQNSTGG